MTPQEKRAENAARILSCYSNAADLITPISKSDTSEEIKVEDAAKSEEDLKKEEEENQKKEADKETK